MIRISRIVENCLTALCFAVPGAAFFSSVAGTDGGPLHTCLAGLGTFLTALLIRGLLISDEPSLAKNALSGTIIGIAAYPVIFFTFAVVLTLLDILGLVPALGNNRVQVNTLSEFLTFLMFLALFWGALMICGMGWITLVLGTFLGLLIGIIEQMSSSLPSGDSRNSNAIWVKAVSFVLVCLLTVAASFLLGDIP